MFWRLLLLLLLRDKVFWCAHGEDNLTVTETSSTTFTISTSTSYTISTSTSSTVSSTETTLTSSSSTQSTTSSTSSSSTATTATSSSSTQSTMTETSTSTLSNTTTSETTTSTTETTTSSSLSSVTSTSTSSISNTNTTTTTSVTETSTGTGLWYEIRAIAVMPMITGNAYLLAEDPNADFAAEVLVAEILDVHPQYVNAVYQLPEEGSTSADLVTQAIAFRRTVQQSRQEAQRMEALLAAITVGELTRRLRAGEGMRQYVFSFTDLQFSLEIVYPLNGGKEVFRSIGTTSTTELPEATSFSHVRGCFFWSFLLACSQCA